MPSKPRTPVKSQRKGFVKGDLVYFDKTVSVDDNIYCVEGVMLRDRPNGEPYPSLLKLRLVFRVFYSYASMDMFHSYDETLCSLLDLQHVESMKKKFGDIITNIAELYEERKKEVDSARTNSPSKPTRKRPTLESKSDGPKKDRGGSKKAL